MLQAVNLHKSFGKNKILDGINFHIEKGSIHGLLGPEGSGKSLIMQICAGVMKPDFGMVRIAGENAFENVSHLYEKVGYMPEGYGIYDKLTVMEYMKFNAGLGKIRSRDSYAICSEILDLVKLSDAADEQILKLNQAMKRRVSLARCMIHKPSLLILDELFTNIDVNERMELAGILRKVNEMGATIFLTSSIFHELDSICTEIDVMDKGKIIVQGTVNELMEKINASRPIFITVLEGRDKAVKILKAEEDVISISTEENKISIHYAGEQKEEANLLTKLISNGVPVLSYGRGKGSLEDLFYKLR